jgi:hypothetical protein
MPGIGSTGDLGQGNIELGRATGSSSLIIIGMTHSFPIFLRPKKTC